MKVVPRYIMENDGSLTEITNFVQDPLVEEGCDCIGMEKGVAKLVALSHPELVISREKYEELQFNLSIERYNERFKPVFDAFMPNGKLTAVEYSRLSGLCLKGAEITLERFYRAGIIGRDRNEYTLTDENIENTAVCLGLVKKAK